MTDFVLLDVGLGVIFAVLTFSLIASALQEALASALNWRGRMLRHGIFRLLEGAIERGNRQAAGLTLDFLRDPGIRSLYGPQNLLGRLWDLAVGVVAGRGDIEGLGRMPSSIPKDTFARALIDTLMRDAKAVYGDLELADGVQAAELPATVAATRALLQGWAARIDEGVAGIAATVEALPMDRAMKDRLLATVREFSMARELQDRLVRFEGNAVDARAEFQARIDRARLAVDATVADVGAWFDTAMDRVTGWYVRRAKWVLFVLGFLMAAVVNFDVIGYGDQLLNDEGLRRRIATQAEAAAVAEAVGGFRVQGAGAMRLAALRLNTGRDQRIDEAEFAAGQAELPPDQRLALGLDPDPAVPVTPQSRAAALAILNATLAQMPGAVAVSGAADRDGDGRIGPDEEDAAVELFLANLRDEIAASARLLRDQLSDQGVEMGWKCPGGALSLACVGGQINLQSVVSWLVVGLGCTLGGQFWFDLLRQAIKVKTAASGLNSDLKRLTGAIGGPAQGSGSGETA